MKKKSITDGELLDELEKDPKHRARKKMLNEKQLAQEVGALPLQHRVAFAASCCERLLPNYRAFTAIEHWGNPQLLRQALDEVWNFLQGEAIPEERIQILTQEIYAVIPDSEDFSSLFADLAIDAGAAIVYTLQMCVDGDIQRVLWVSRASTNTVYQYLGATTDPKTQVHQEDHKFEAWIWKTPLMVAELEKQWRDLQTLKARQVFDPVFLEEVRTSSRVLGVQPIARGIVKEDV